MYKPDKHDEALNSTCRCLKPVFIVGCPRSGTTWMMLLLSQHPSISVCTHSYLFQVLLRLGHLWKEPSVWMGSTVSSEWKDNGGKKSERKILTRNEFFDICHQMSLQIFDKVRRSKEGAFIVVDQTPEHLLSYDFIHGVWPNAQFIHMVRDPRSVVASMREASTTDWGKELPGNIRDAAYRWHYFIKNKPADPDPKAYMEVKYEALVEDGSMQLDNIFRWLGVESQHSFCTEAIENCSIKKLKSGSPNKLTRFFRKGVTNGWQNELSSFEIRLIEYINRDFMEKLGYECTGNPSFAAQLRCKTLEGWHKLIDGLKQRKVRMLKSMKRKYT